MELRRDYKNKLERIGYYSAYEANIIRECQTEAKIKRRLEQVNNEYTLPDALATSFMWHNSKEGYEFWKHVASMFE